MEISIGIFIATLVSQFVLPIHARTHLRRAQASTLSQLRDLYIEAMMTPHSDTQTFSYLELDEEIVKSLTKQRQLAKESTHEPVGSTFDPENFMHSFHCEKEMLRAIDFMHHALTQITLTHQTFVQPDALREFNDKIVLALNTIIRVIEAGQPGTDHIHVPSPDSLKQMMQKDDVFYIDGFLFSAEILTHNLGKLAQYYHLPIFDAQT